ncbi:MAG TPA: hypothetical protein EYO59_00550 [Chromatiaceae bacterium]|nr:hypothetical protein [Chromatiaceae bacterium]
MKVQRLSAPRPQNIVMLLTDKRPVIRALSCELLGWRLDRSASEMMANLAKHDSSPHVRQACEVALLKIRRKELVSAANSGP